MNNSELKRYASKKLKEGFSEEQIRASLKGAGYDDEQINAAMYQAKEAEKPSADKKQRPKVSIWWFILLILFIIGVFALVFYFRIWDPVWNPFNELLPG